MNESKKLIVLDHKKRNIDIPNTAPVSVLWSEKHLEILYIISGFRGFIDPAETDFSDFCIEYLSANNEAIDIVIISTVSLKKTQKQASGSKIYFYASIHTHTYHNNCNYHLW
jgi:hypothetical protein